MALPPNLPPQAYTRDTLVKAIEWLTTQPAAIRERANSADLIVSHFLASRRRTPYVNEAAMADFKTLAEDIRQLDEPPAYLTAPPITAHQTSAPQTKAVPPRASAKTSASTSTTTDSSFTDPVDEAPSAAFDEPIPEYTPRTASPRGRRREAPRAGVPAAHSGAFEAAPVAYGPSTSVPVAEAPEPSSSVGPARGTPDGDQSARGFSWTVDQRSRTIAREVQDRMNLSSESEALRMLVAMGAERLRSVLP